MNENIYAPNIIDFAYEIISLHEENEQLKLELAHYKKMHNINSRSIQESIDSSYKTVGLVLSACLDPDSSINKIREKHANT